MKSVKEAVRKALLNNGTKDDMYKDIVAEFGCSRHAAKVLLHSFIWECPEAYMVHAAFYSPNLIGDIKVGTEFKEPVLGGDIYQIKDFQTQQVIARGLVERVYDDGKYTISIFEYAKGYSHLCGIRLLVTKEDLVMSSEDKELSIPHYEIVR